MTRDMFISKSRYDEILNMSENAIVNYVKKVREVAELRHENEAYIDKVIELTRGTFELKVDREELIEQRDNARQLAADLEAENALLKESTIKICLNEYRAAVDVTDEYQCMKDTLESREYEIDYLREKIKSLTAKLDDATKNAEVLKTMVAERDKRVEKLILKLEGRRNEKGTTSTSRHSKIEEVGF